MSKTLSRLKKYRRKRRKLAQPYAKIDWEKASMLFKQSDISVGKNNKYPPVRDILYVLAAAGGVGLMFAFPGAAVGIGALVLGDSTYSRWGSKKIIERMAKQKYVKIRNNVDGSVTVAITKRGRLRALTYKLSEMKLKKPNRWDRKWRVVLFDIPEKYKKVRDIFRDNLIQLGLYQFQESVYVSPIPCFDEIVFLKELYGIGFKVRYLLVEKIEDDEDLRRYFELK